LLTDLLMFAGLMVVTVALGTVANIRTYDARTAWLSEGRTPTDRERARTLAAPLVLAATPLVLWLLAAIYTCVLNAWAGHTATHILKVAIACVLGGLVSAAVAYFFVERAFRPIFRLALAGQPVQPRFLAGVTPRMLLTWEFVAGVPLTALALLPFAAHEADDPRIGGAVAVLSVAGLFIGAVATFAAARSIAEPLASIRGALERVKRGDLDVEIPVDDGGEIGMLQSGVNDMVAGLRERRRLADLFGRHVGVEVAERAIAQGTGLESEQREASALFVDLVGSTAMAEVLPPQEVVRTLNAFFGAVVRVVSAEGGWVNKFEGDGALCVFGAPAHQTDHAARALRAARKLRDDLRLLADTHPGLDAAIGVSSGTVVAANVGTEQRYEYTIIGRPVNEAARLTDLAKGRAGRLVVSGAALDRAGDEAARWTSLGTVALRGQAAPAAIFEPLPAPASSGSSAPSPQLA
jgi:adenylate cyclase